MLKRMSGSAHAGADGVNESVFGSLCRLLPHACTRIVLQHSMAALTVSVPWMRDVSALFLPLKLQPGRPPAVGLVGDRRGG